MLQPLARRVVWAAVRREPATMMRYAEGAQLPIPDWFARLNAPLVSRLAAKLNGAGDLTIRADLRSLPSHLDRVDRWIARRDARRRVAATPPTCRWRRACGCC